MLFREHAVADGENGLGAIGLEFLGDGVEFFLQRLRPGAFWVFGEGGIEFLAGGGKALCNLLLFVADGVQLLDIFRVFHALFRRPHLRGGGLGGGGGAIARAAGESGAEDGAGEGQGEGGFCQRVLHDLIPFWGDYTTKERMCGKNH